MTAPVELVANVYSKRKQSRVVTHGDHALVELTKGLWAAIDLADVPLVAGYAWQAVMDKGGGFRARGMVDGEEWPMHRFIIGERDPSVYIDHRDTDGLNNRRYNLRRSTPMQNSRNQGKRRHNTTGFKGVFLDKRAIGRPKPWTSSIQIGGRLKWLGSFAEKEEAALAYDAAARLHHGAFARLNFPGPEEMQA